MQGCTYDKYYKKINLIYIKLKQNHMWIIYISLKIKYTQYH
jgi:hypothetical protein